MGRRPQRPFRGLLSVHYSLRPACFANLLSRPFPAVLQPICCLLSRSRCFWSERQLTSRDFHPVMSVPSQGAHNPYSEALFRTLKYCPSFPKQPFADLAAARAWVEHFVRWYNSEHLHSAIRFVTPDARHFGLDLAQLAQRRKTYELARAKHPERWSRATRNWEPILIVTLNPERGLVVSEPTKRTA